MSAVLTIEEAEKLIAERPRSEHELRECPDPQLVHGRVWDLMVITVVGRLGDILQLYANAGWDFVQLLDKYQNRDDVWRDMGGYLVIMRRPAVPKPVRQRKRRP